MNIYLDIDGVLIDKHGVPAPGVVDFLKDVTDNHNCYWLSTHCRGDSQKAIYYLKKYLPADTFQYLEKIKPTSWNTWKTEAIDFSQEFRWYDDYIMEAERMVLQDRDKLDRFVLVNINENSDKPLVIL